MSVADVFFPGIVGECPRADPEILEATRGAAMIMTDTAGEMARHAAPAGWVADEQVLAEHKMTAAARTLDGASAALQTGVLGLQRYVITIEDDLTGRHRDLETRRTDLMAAARELRARTAGGEDAAALQPDIESHNLAVMGFDQAAAAWRRDRDAAEDALVAALRSADTAAEGRALAAEMPSLPALVERAEALRQDPAAVFAWWMSLTALEQEALKSAHPELIGNLDGIPIADRDDANRAHLEARRQLLQLQRDDGSIDADGWSELQKIREVTDALDRPRGLVESYLLLFDSDAADGDGYAAVAYGNPETADHVTVNVPGFSSEMSNFGGVAGDAYRLWQATDRQDNGSVASIAWLGYDAPSGGYFGGRDVAGVASQDMAAAGAANLTRFVEGLEAVRHRVDDGNRIRANVTVVGHSYGSTTVAIAAGTGMRADNVVLVGGPGVGDGPDVASGLHGEVFVGSADEDFVTRLGNPFGIGLGNDPASDDFAAKRFAVEDGRPFSIGLLDWKGNIDNHTGYFTERSPQLKALSLIAADRSDRLETIPGREPTENPSWWAEKLLPPALNPSLPTSPLWWLNR